MRSQNAPNRVLKAALKVPYQKRCIIIAKKILLSLLALLYLPCSKCGATLAADDHGPEFPNQNLNIPSNLVLYYIRAECLSRWWPPTKILNTPATAVSLQFGTESSSDTAERPHELGDFKKVQVIGGTDNHCLKDSHKCLRCHWQTRIIW